jgi:hypothetical protein
MLVPRLRQRVSGVGRPAYMSSRPAELGLDDVVLPWREERGFELLQRGHKDFEDIGAAIGAEAAAQAHPASPRADVRSASKKA